MPVHGDEVRKKRFVRVRAEVDEAGNVTPRAVVWPNGTVYEIFKVRGSCRVKWPGQSAIRYDVLVGKDGYWATSIFFDGRRWFVRDRRRGGDGADVDGGAGRAVGGDGHDLLAG